MRSIKAAILQPSRFVECVVHFIELRLQVSQLFRLLRFDDSIVLLTDDEKNERWFKTKAFNFKVQEKIAIRINENKCIKMRVSQPVEYQRKTVRCRDLLSAISVTCLFE